MSWGGSSAEGADVFRVLGAYMVQRLALEASYDSGSGQGFRSVGDDDRVVAGPGLLNHLQSSGECNTSRVHSRSTLLDRPSPTLLSWHRVMTILFPCGKGRCGS